MSGAVLAGGHSLRMGRDKATLVLDGVPLWRRQLRVLAAAGAAPVAVIRRRDQSRLGARCWRDRRAASGPLAGIEAALHRARGTHVAILAVDLPFASAACFQFLASACAAGSGAVARRAGRFEPLLAIYPRAALAAVARRLDRGEFQLQSLLAALVASGQMTPLRIPAAHLPDFRNFNTLARWRSITARSPSRPKARVSTKSPAW